MKLNLSAIFSIIFLASCSPMIVQSSSAIADSTRVECRERLFLDTVVVQLPVIREVNVTRDTSSILENDFAESEARVEGGLLRHSLSTKPATIKAPVSVVVRDTVIIREKGSTVTQERVVEIEKPLSWLQKTLMYAGAAAIIAILILIISKFFKKKLNI